MMRSSGEQKANGGGVIVVTILIAMVLSVVPMPEWARLWRPEWTVLVVLYWAMAVPQRVGVGVAWTLGLLMDVLHGTLLGQYAIALAVVAYLMGSMYRRIRVFPLWQQAVVVMVLLAIYQTLTLWIRGIAGHPPGTLMYWAPVASGTLLWPWVFVLLRDLRRRYKVS
ncbi:MAG: rod shape-determining protein MreD [Gammaproteobacteria bacterium]